MLFLSWASAASRTQVPSSQALRLARAAPDYKFRDRLSLR